MPGDSYGQRSLVGCSPWGCKESDMTEAIYHVCMHAIRDWLTWFWRLRSPRSSVRKLETLEFWDLDGVVQSYSKGRWKPNVPTWRQRLRERILSCSAFYSIQAFSRLDEPTHTGESNLLHFVYWCSCHFSDAHVIRQLFPRHSQDNNWLDIWVPVGQPSCTCNLSSQHPPVSQRTEAENISSFSHHFSEWSWMCWGLGLDTCMSA